MARFIVTAEEAGLRVDAFLVRRGHASSGAAARRLIAEGGVRVDGRRAAKGRRLEPGAAVEVLRAAAPPPGPPEAAPEVALEVLYQDEHIVAINKPAGLPSHPLRAGEGPTAAGALIARFPECATASVDPREGGLGHRLDTNTSGVLIAARSRAAWERLRAALGAGECEKVYVAEAHGDPGAQVIEAPIGRRGRRSGRVKVGAGRGLLPARTAVRVLEMRGETALVEARLARGRPHQVRVHLAALDCPIWGDAIYGRGEPGGLHLHAAAVTFRHPHTTEIIRIVAPLPQWAQSARSSQTET